MKKLVLIIIFTAILQIYGAQKNISYFSSPISGSHITEPLCTLNIISPSPSDSVVISVEYQSVRGTTRKRHLATLKNRPYKLIFDASKIPNQYYFGAKFIGEVYRMDDTVEIAIIPNIYTTAHKESVKSYNYYNIKDSTKPSAIIAPIEGLSSKLFITYNNDGIGIESIIKSEKENTLSISNFSDSSGITILLDPTLEKAPYPQNGTITLFIPFSEDLKPQLITEVIDGNSEEFIIKKSGTPISLNRNIIYRENGEISISIIVPNFLIGGKSPDSLGINILIPVTNDISNGGKEPFLSLIKNEDFFAQLAPMLFPIFTKKVITVANINSFPLYRYYLLPFLIGLIISVLIFIIKRNIDRKKRQHISMYNNKINELIGDSICRGDCTTELSALKFNMSENELNKLSIKETGYKFEKYIIKARIEIVKERLRSSNVSEISITKDVGFNSLIDMENAFIKETNIAPYKFREKYSS